MPGARGDRGGLLGLWLCGREGERQRWLLGGMIKGKNKDDQGKNIINK